MSKEATEHTKSSEPSLLRKAFACIAAAALAIALCLPATTTSAWAEDSLDTSSKEISQSSDQMRKQAASIRQSIDLLQTSLNSLQEEYANAQRDYEDATVAVEDAKQRYFDATKKLGVLQTQLERRVVSMYKGGGQQTMLDVLLGSTSFSDLLRTLEATERMADSNADLVQKVRDARNEAEDARIENENKQQNAQEKMEAVNIAQMSLQTDMTNMKNALGKVDSVIAKLDSLAEETEVDEAAARQLEQKATAAVSQATLAATGASANTVGWVMPLDSYVVSSEYGVRIDPIDGKPSAFHSGIDLAAPSGTPVHAAKSGTVTYAGDYGTGGNAVIVNHGNGIRTVYMHMSGFNVGQGQGVMAGDVVGFVGTTGRSTGPHLHFNVEVDTTPVNPRLVLKF